MKFVDEYRGAAEATTIAEAIRKTVTRPWIVMEVCGGQTHTIVRFGIDEILPRSLELVHGPGCPVCVTPVQYLDKAYAIATMPGVIFCSFGDMLRVPGSRGTLLQAKAAGADIRVVYSPADALRLARANPDRQVVFFAVGFETTAPATAWVVDEAARLGIDNFSILLSHVLVPPAMETILSSSRNLVQGFLAAGHVCAVMGLDEYVPIAMKYRVPIVVTGFEPLDIMAGLLACVRQLEAGRHVVENQYTRAVMSDGNVAARELIRRVFEIVPREWRGLGSIAGSGLRLRAEYARFDAEQRFGPVMTATVTDKSYGAPYETGGLAVACGCAVPAKSLDSRPACLSGLVLQGVLKPPDCPAFGTACTPESPLGAPMVSSEGACAAYYRYRRKPAAGERPTSRIATEDRQ